MADSTALIVDDEEDIRELVSLSLAPLGIRVTGAGSVTEARRELQRGAFDVCITDMRLPDGSGLELIEHVQQVRPQMPVAMISTSTSPARGPSRSTSMISSGLPAATATAARVFIVGPPSDAAARSGIRTAACLCYRSR